MGNLNLLGSRSLEAQVKAIVGQGADFARLAIIAYANDGHLGALDHLHEFGNLSRD